MARNLFHVLLVIGDDHQAISEKYSLQKECEPRILMKKKDAATALRKHIKFVENLLNTDYIELSEKQYDEYKDMYLGLKDMTSTVYFQYMTSECDFDEEGNALTTENPDAKYKFSSCPQKWLDKGEVGNFADPFILKDGTLSYVAKKGDVDWDKMHLAKQDYYRSAWELAVDDREPRNDEEKRIKENLALKLNYFQKNFNDADEYVLYASSFWCYAVATEDDYKAVSYKISDMDWIIKFYDTFIKDLPDDTLLSLYEIRDLRD